MLEFNDTRLLDGVMYGSEFSQEFKTTIITTRGGAERRNIEWSMPLGRYRVLYKLTNAHAMQIRNAHLACLGSAIGFRFKDWVDYSATNEKIGVTQKGLNKLQLIKSYNFGGVELNKKIFKPVKKTVTITIKNKQATNAYIDYSTGEVSFNYDADGDIVYWSGEYDIPVRFASDRLDFEPLALDVNSTDKGYVLATDADLVEVRF